MILKLDNKIGGYVLNKIQWSSIKDLQNINLFAALIQNILLKK